MLPKYSAIREFMLLSRSDASRIIVFHSCPIYCTKNRLSLPLFNGFRPNFAVHRCPCTLLHHILLMAYTKTSEMETAARFNIAFSSGFIVPLIFLSRSSQVHYRLSRFSFKGNLHSYTKLTLNCWKQCLNFKFQFEKKNQHSSVLKYDYHVFSLLNFPHVAISDL